MFFGWFDATFGQSVSWQKTSGFLLVFIPCEHPGLFHDLMRTALLYETAEEVKTSWL